MSTTSVKKFLARKKRKRDKSPGHAIDFVKEAAIPQVKDQTDEEEMFGHVAEATQEDNEETCLDTAAPEPVKESTQASMSQDDQATKEMNYQTPGEEEDIQETCLGGEEEHPFQSTQLGPLDSPQSSNTPQAASKEDMKSETTRLEQLLEKKDVIIQHLGDDLQHTRAELHKTRSELQVSRAQSQKHKQKAFDIHQKFVRWDKMLQEWMARNSSKPMKEWEDRPGFSVIPPKQKGDQQPAGGSNKFRKATSTPEAQSSTAAKQPEPVAPKQRNNKSRETMGSSFTEVARAKEQAAHGSESLNSMVSSVSGNETVNLQPAHASRKIMVSPTTETPATTNEEASMQPPSRLLPITVNQNQSGQERSENEPTRRITKEKVSVSCHENTSKAKSTPRANQQTSDTNKSRKTTESPTVTFTAGASNPQPVFQSRNARDSSTVIPASKTRARVAEQPTNAKLKSDSVQQPVQEDHVKESTRPLVKKINTKKQREHLTDPTYVAKQSNANVDDSDDDELLRDAIMLSQKRNAESSKKTEGKAVSTSTDKENYYPNLQDPRRVTMSPPAKAESPLSQGSCSTEGSHTQLEPHASRLTRIPPEANKSRVLQQNRLLSSGSVRTAASSKKAKVARHDSSLQISPNESVSNPSVNEWATSQALLVTQSTEKKCTTAQPIVRAPSSIGSRNEQVSKAGTQTATASWPPAKTTITDTTRYSVSRALNGWRSNVMARTFVDEALGPPVKKLMKENPYKKTTANEKVAPMRVSERAPNVSIASMQPPTNKPPSSTWLKTKATTKNDDEESQSDYKHIEVVRGKKKRACLPGHSCQDCDPFWAAVCDGNDVFDRKQFQDCSRHRSTFSPENTPPNFWELSFRDEVQAREDKKETRQAMHATNTTKMQTKSQPTESMEI
jgi:hypothetical protein